MDQDGTWHGGRPQPRRPCGVRWGPSPSSKRRQSQFLAHFYCDQTAGCINMPLGIEVGLSPGDFVLDGDPVSLPKKGWSPQFSTHVYCGQTAAWIKMPCTWYGGRRRPMRRLRDIVLDGDPAPPNLKGHSRQFSAIVRCGQMAGWTKMPLGME